MMPSTLLLLAVLGAAPGCPSSLPELYDRLSPAVVSISASSVNPYDVGGSVSRVVGSGFVIEASGLVLTNSHLVFGKQAITVTLDDGTVLPAELRGADPILDIAAVQIPAAPGRTLATAPLGDSDRVAVGQDVLAIGNPLGLQQTLTHGIVSAVNRLLPNIPFSLNEPLIQVDAPINPGNSGGPLLSACGEVLGITTAMVPDAQSIGFAVPINLAKEILPKLLAQGRVIRPWLGVQGQLVSPPLKELLRMPLADGFLVEMVEPGSPAEQVGLRGGQLDLVIGGQPVLIGGDVITAVGDARIENGDDLGRVLKTLSVGTTLKLTVARGAEALQLQCVLSERPLLPGDIPARRASAPLATARRPRLAF